MLDNIQNGCRPEIFNKGHMGSSMTKRFQEKPKCNSCFKSSKKTPQNSYLLKIIKN